MDVSGKIKVVGEVVEKGTFKSRNVVITTDEQYPQHISIQFVQDKCDILNGYNVGESVMIGINLRGREWTNAKGEEVYFNTIQGWYISKLDTSNQSPEPKTFAEVSVFETDESDLPF
jgi:hypothetical protein